MWVFKERNNKKYVECKGPGPHITKNGSPWLVVGLHKYVEIEDGTVRCKRCAEKRPIPKAPDYDKPIGFLYLTDQEVRELRYRLRALQEYIGKDKGREPVLLDKKEQETRQSKFSNS